MNQSEKTELTVSRIMKAALEEFGNNGYAAGTVNNICKKGINKGLIYHNFKDKNELYLACLRQSCRKLMNLIDESGCRADLLRYMNVRMDFFTRYSNEAHIFFEAVIEPQESLRNEITEILRPFEEINEEIYRTTVSSVTLRDGITEEDAITYFRQMQRMFNGYFSSPAYRKFSVDRQIEEHETNIPKLLDFMIYGIAKGDERK